MHNFFHSTQLENVTKSILVNKDSPRSAVNFASTVSATSSASSKPGRVDGKPPGSSPAPVTPSQPIKNQKSEKIELPLKLPFLDFKESQEEAKKATPESTKKNVEVQKVRFLLFSCSFLRSFHTYHMIPVVVR